MVLSAGGGTSPVALAEVDGVGVGGETGVGVGEGGTAGAGSGGVMTGGVVVSTGATTGGVSIGGAISAGVGVGFIFVSSVIWIKKSINIGLFVFRKVQVGRDEYPFPKTPCLFNS